MTSVLVKVRTPAPIKVAVSADPLLKVAMRRVVISNAKLEDLLNVDEIPYGLYDGFTVVYDLATKTWKTAPISTQLNEAVDLDGGGY